MPQTHFVAEDASAIIPLHLWPKNLDLLAPSTPTLLAALADSVLNRRTVDRIDQISASQIGDDARLLFLKETVDYGMKPSAMLDGYLGTLRHTQINLDRPGGSDFIVESRYSDDLGSGQLDSYHIPTQWLIDLKNLGAYKLKLMLANIEEHGWEYIFQLNRLRNLLEKNTDYRVNRITLEVIPSDRTRPTLAQLTKQAEAVKRPIVTPKIWCLDIPSIDPHIVDAVYRDRLKTKLNAHDGRYVPPCQPKFRWDGRRCTDFCPVRNACHDYDVSYGHTPVVDPEDSIAYAYTPTNLIP